MQHGSRYPGAQRPKRREVKIGLEHVNSWIAYYDSTRNAGMRESNGHSRVLLQKSSVDAVSTPTLQSTVFKGAASLSRDGHNGVVGQP